MAILASAKEFAQSASSSANAGDPKLGRILALDYGRKRIGLALSDETRLTARPLETIERTNRSELFHRLRQVARREQVRHILVGHPLNLDGSAGEMATEAAAFANRLQKELGLPVELFDERLTSWAAGSLPGKKASDDGDDAAAAAILLQDYLDHIASHRAQGTLQPPEVK
jgi:putative holliday junction resolvase